MRFHVAEVGDKRDWHRKFAWLPRYVGRNDVRWLEFVERRGEFVNGYYSPNFWEWEYRARK